MEKAAQKKGEELGIHLDLKKSIFQMTPAQKKCVEILRAMMSDCKLMILDEPTASLSDKEANLLFSIIRNLKAKGTAVLYVTHRLEEIMALTDRVTVLRNGELVSTCDTASTSQKELVRLMSGNGEADSKHMMPDSTCCSRSAGHTIIPCTHHLPSFLCRPHCKRRQYHRPHRTHHRHVRSLRQRTDGISGMYLRHPAHIRRNR